jgi:hypothetical protein
MKSTLISGLTAAGVMVAAMAPGTVKAEPQVLTIAEMDMIAAGLPGGWRGIIIQLNRADVRQDVSVGASCQSNCSVSVAATAVAIVEQNNKVD